MSKVDKDKVGELLKVIVDAGGVPEDINTLSPEALEAYNELFVILEGILTPVITKIIEVTRESIAEELTKQENCKQSWKV